MNEKGAKSELADELADGKKSQSKFTDKFRQKTRNTDGEIRPLMREAQKTTTIM